MSTSLFQHAGARPAVRPERNLPHHLSRVVDLVAVIILLSAIAPALALIAILVKLDGGPILIGHPSYGVGHPASATWRFRTTTCTGGVIRETAVGRVLRSHGLDGLPSLFNVLSGDASLADLAGS